MSNAALVIVVVPPNIRVRLMKVGLQSELLSTTSHGATVCAARHAAVTTDGVSAIAIVHTVTNRTMATSVYVIRMTITHDDHLSMTSIRIYQE